MRDAARTHLSSLILKAVARSAMGMGWVSAFSSPVQTEAGWAAIYLWMVDQLSSDTTLRFAPGFCFLIINLHIPFMFDAFSGP